MDQKKESRGTGKAKPVGPDIQVDDSGRGSLRPLLLLALFFMAVVTLYVLRNPS